ncbi:hypothetical protein TIFTF001_006547 [Ficus carica]|uniref:Uncharacterized protein n=1 Tax=Ficus carica TaxID=3494 RepID=A0AA88CYU3_FICCA|nr:hypothetical protein TIFTF001_006547 [Ficus carica]
MGTGRKEKKKRNVTVIVGGQCQERATKASSIGGEGTVEDLNGDKSRANTVECADQVLLLHTWVKILHVNFCYFYIEFDTRTDKSSSHSFGSPSLTTKSGSDIFAGHRRERNMMIDDVEEEKVKGPDKKKRRSF